MKPNSLTVFELFERQQRYVVPLFQRPYVWSREKQWVPLWGDIEAKAEEVINSQQYHHREPGKHFLGAIVLNPIRTSGLQVTAKSIIDGQQRLTTLQVILLALRDFMKNHEFDDLLRDVELHTENQCRMEHPFERYKVWPTNADRAIFEAVFDSGSPDALKTRFPPIRKKYKRHYEPNPRLVDTYLYFYDAISTYLYSDGDNGEEEFDPREVVSERLSAIVEAFKRHLEIVTIDLDEQDNPQIIFETLNYRGEPLLPSDLIRNFVFLEATRNKEDVQALYDTYWQAYDVPSSDGKQNFWKELERQGRLRRERIDLFVFHYLVFRTQSDIYITKLYQEFRDWWNEEPRQAETELRSLQKYSQIFRTFYKPDVTSRVGMFKHRLRTLDVSTVYPLLLFLLGEQEGSLSEEEIAGMVTDLESYLVRRMICQLTTKNYNNVFLSLLRNLRKAEQVNRNSLQKLLLGLTGASARWPDDEELKANWLSVPAYRAMGSSRTKLILEALDLQLTTRKQEHLHITDPLTVEHILPQGWSPDNWPLPQVEGDMTEEEQLAQRANMLHTFGNLTLLTSSLNPSVSNSPFKIKRPEITQHSRLRLNAYFQSLSDQDEWNEAKIIERGESLFKMVIQIWPYPSENSDDN